MSSGRCGLRIFVRLLVEGDDQGGDVVAGTLLEGLLHQGLRDNLRVELRNNEALYPYVWGILSYLLPHPLEDEIDSQLVRKDVEEAVAGQQ